MKAAALLSCHCFIDSVCAHLLMGCIHKTVCGWKEVEGKRIQKWKRR